jgi:hypothetical protein
MTNSVTLTDQSDSSSNAPRAKEEPFLQPWQFFLLGGMLAATAAVIVATGQSPANIIILSITVVSVSFVGLGAYRMLSPLVSNQPDAPMTIGGRTRIALEREKALVLRSIKELEFDFAMGKIAKPDFDEMSARLRSRAVGLMKQLDAGGGYKELIQKEVQKRLNDDLDSDGFSRRFEAEAMPKGIAVQSVCDSCGTQNDTDAKFCKNCGAKL